MEDRESGATVRVDEMLDSALESVDSAEETALNVARDIGFAPEELDGLGMAVREAMVNAVVHGNRYNANKRVRFRVLQAFDGIQVEITDEGEGFDPDAVPDPLKEENLLQQSGRGLLLIRAFVDEFEIQRAHPRGMRAMLLKRRVAPEQ